MGPVVAVTSELPGDALERLAAVAEVLVWREPRRPTPGELASFAQQAAGLVTLLGDRVDAALLDRLPALRVVANVAVGYDNLDLVALSQRNVLAGNTPDVLTASTAELTFALALGAARRLREGIDVVARRAWPAWDPAFLLGRQLAGARLGVVGAGRIGSAVARRGRAFEMDVVSWSRSGRPAEGAVALPLDELLGTSDVVSLHVALTPETTGLIGARELALMKREAILVNTARGAVVDQRALYVALSTGVIGAAGLDVLEVEPPPPGEPLLELPNCLVLPHLGSATREAREAMARLAAENVIAVLEGRPMPAPITAA